MCPWEGRARTWAAEPRREGFDRQHAGHLQGGDLRNAPGGQARIEVFTAEPEDLDREFSRLLPQLVVCNRPTKRVEFEARVWIELYPDGASHAVVKNLDGPRTFLPTMDFDKLLTILDGI